MKGECLNWVRETKSPFEVLLKLDQLEYSGPHVIDLVCIKVNLRAEMKSFRDVNDATGTSQNHRRVASGQLRPIGLGGERKNSWLR